MWNCRLVWLLKKMIVKQGRLSVDWKVISLGETEISILEKKIFWEHRREEKRLKHPTLNPRKNKQKIWWTYLISMITEKRMKSLNSEWASLKTIWLCVFRPDMRMCLPYKMAVLLLWIFNNSSSNCALKKISWWWRVFTLVFRETPVSLPFSNFSCLNPFSRFQLPLKSEQKIGWNAARLREVCQIFVMSYAQRLAFAGKSEISLP